MRAGEMGDCMYFINAGFVQVPLSPKVSYPSSSFGIHDHFPLLWHSFPPLFALPWIHQRISLGVRVCPWHRMHAGLS